MKNFNLFTCLMVVAISFLSINNLSAQAPCIPAGVQPVFGTVSGASGSFNFANVPTGNVITINAPAADVLYNISLCSTNPAGWADGTNDSRISILDANASTANAIAVGDDGCPDGAGPQFWGPTNMNFQSPAAGTYYIYLTEWGATACVADGANSNYMMDITITTPGPCDAGVLTSPLTQSVCPGDDFSTALDGSQVSDGGFLLGFSDAQGGTGGLAGGFTLSGYIASSFPLSQDNDLNGVLSFNQLPPLSGLWEVKVYAVDAIGGRCDSTGIMTINFLSQPADIFVDQSATGANDGSSWADAFTNLQSAFDLLNASDCSVDILVAEGTYKRGPNRGNFLSIASDCRVFGGYPAGGAATSTPDVTPTILSGDIDGDGTVAGNTFHALSINNGDTNDEVFTAILVDLIIEGGNADGALSQFGRSRGGGVYINDAIAGFFRCTIRNSFASLGGGVFSTLSETTLFQDCTITGNEAGNGSALYHSNETRMFIERSRIVDNNSTTRCAVEINNSLYTSIENSVIANNASLNANAIAFIATNRNQLCDIRNSTILGETKNKQLITMQVGFGDTLDVNMCNTIVAHQNPSHFRNIKEFNNNVLNFTHTNCFFSGSGLPDVPSATGTNPLFADAGALVFGTDPDNPYALAPCSPGVDAGVADCLDPAVDTFDIILNPRTFGSAIDIGAYEAQAACAPIRENNSTEEITANTISIFPNPVNDIVNIRTDLEGISVVISDVLGRTIIESANQRSIDISKLLRGTYILQVYQGDELKATEKLMKN